MNTNRRYAVAALIAAGLLWGTTVPLTKLALAWLPPGWLTAVRFGLAAAVLLAAARRRGQGTALRDAFTPAVLAAGALGYGGSVLVQNAGISRTSVTHAALLIGAVPVLVAIIAAVWHRTVARPVAWFGFAVSLGGVGLVTAGGGGGGATLAGDGLVLLSLLLQATVTVAQARLLAGRDPVAVTAVQFLGATLASLPVAVVTEGMPAAPADAGVLLAVVALALAGTLAPFTLFAFGQSRVSAEVAGAFLNLEPLVGAIAGVVAFGDPAGLAQFAGGTAILAGIALSSLPLLTTRRTAPHRQAVTAKPRIEKLVRWTCRERIRFRWYLLRLTVREMNYAVRRMTELHISPVTSRHQHRTPGDDQARDPSCIRPSPGGNSARAGLANASGPQVTCRAREISGPPGRTPLASRQPDERPGIPPRPPRRGSVVVLECEEGTANGSGQLRLLARELEP